MQKLCDYQTVNDKYGYLLEKRLSIQEHFEHIVNVYSCQYIGLRDFTGKLSISSCGIWFKDSWYVTNEDNSNTCSITYIGNNTLKIQTGSFLFPGIQVDITNTRT